MMIGGAAGFSGRIHDRKRDLGERARRQALLAQEGRKWGRDFSIIGIARDFL